ncbi:MAG: serine/threonine protein kinase, partial [Holophagales bacterium]|nr:serine/threonine protein kinase [Holophagales bacterium]
MTDPRDPRSRGVRSGVAAPEEGRETELGAEHDDSLLPTERHPAPAQNPAADREPGPRRELGYFAAGALVAGRYEIVRFLARGGIGEVYEVLDRELGERLALKTLQAHEAGDGLARERFRREIQLARRVTHPNVCRLFDAGSHRQEGRPPLLFLTMELLEGESLHDRLLRGGRLEPTEALPLLRQMCAALTAAHTQGIVHRDFKSGNVILVPSKASEGGTERAVVTDFGLARAIADDEGAVFRTVGTGGMSGTPAYMAPEQLRDGEIGPATDIYALGVVVFQMLTGELPFDSRSALASAVRRLREPPPSPRSKVSGLGRRWETAILRCLEPRPEDRFQEAGQLLDAVEGRAPVALPSRRRRALGGALALAAAGLGSLALWLREASEPAPAP